jgi:hypothetical protein
LEEKGVRMEVRGMHEWERDREIMIIYEWRKSVIGIYERDP